jgi:hypothetical protein
MARFTLPRDLYHGQGALENLKTLTAKKSHRRGGRRLDEAFRFSWTKVENI